MAKESEALETLKKVKELEKLVNETKSNEDENKQEFDKIEQNLTISEEDKKKLDNRVVDIINAMVSDNNMTMTEAGVVMLYGEGERITKISVELGISRQTIYNYLKRKPVMQAITDYRKRIIEASFQRIRDLNLNAVRVLENGLKLYPEKYAIAKFIINTNLNLLEVEKKQVAVSEEKKSFDEKTGEELKREVSIKAENTKKKG